MKHKPKEKRHSQVTKWSFLGLHTDIMMDPKSLSEKNSFGCNFSINYLPLESVSYKMIYKEPIRWFVCITITTKFSMQFKVDVYMFSVDEVNSSGGPRNLSLTMTQLYMAPWFKTKQRPMCIPSFLFLLSVCHFMALLLISFYHIQGWLISWT